ncbi:MAG: OsmC family peroxiredoxin [Anaerolineaceae bacterium]|jgi:osmotically inducible protein OsmC|nr:OsmC family peroxiredoxin [Anaerolineaceae bacterium]MDD4042718.1 OsmC family peroxiredoxin [Anaerolineaceae bacterium]MDD4577073.1 OsmC family peroxiredoxin [Anaerolineaceae bacterium]
MADRKATAVWEGDLKTGKGTMRFADYEGQYSWSSRFEEGVGTNPEELLAGAHAGCFAMSVSSGLTKAGYTAKTIETTAHIALRRIEGKSRIVSSHLVIKAIVPGISDDEFQAIAQESSDNCPVSVALAGIEITHEAELVER